MKKQCNGDWEHIFGIEILGSQQINEAGRWPLYFNKEKGWICLGDPIIKGREFVNFASGCIATLENHELIALWLHPQFSD